MSELTITFQTKDGQSVHLRPAQLEDAHQIVKKAKEIVEDGRFIQKEIVRTPTEEEEFIKDVQRKDNMYIVIQIENSVVGIARLIRGDLQMKRHVALFRTWLSSDTQGKGIGSKIMEYTLQWAKIHQLHKIVLTVFSVNHVAKRLYEKYGFIVEGIQKEQLFINGEFQDEIFMAYFTNK